MESVETINARLREIFGQTTDGKARYRLVWANGQREHRHGTYDIVSTGGIYLRTETGVCDVEKYPFFKDKWILERIEINRSRELPENAYSYEPKWVFRDANNNPLYPHWRVCEIIIKSIEEYEGKGTMTPSDYMAQDENERKKEEELFADMLGEDMRTPMFEDEAAISYAGLDAKKLFKG